MQYLVAWAIYAGAALGVLAIVFLFSRQIPWHWLRTTVRCLAAVWLLLPTPIQAVEGFYAPAFIVAMFEGLFQSNGNPWPALNLLALGTLVALVLVVSGEIHTWRKSKRVSP